MANRVGSVDIVIGQAVPQGLFGHCTRRCPNLHWWSQLGGSLEPRCCAQCGEHAVQMLTYCNTIWPLPTSRHRGRPVPAALLSFLSRDPGRAIECTHASEGDLGHALDKVQLVCTYQPLPVRGPCGQSPQEHCCLARLPCFHPCHANTFNIGQHARTATSRSNAPMHRWRGQC